MKTLVILTVGLLAPTFAAFADFAEMRGMHDGEIVDVVFTANNIAIEAGNLAPSRSFNEDIKAYAAGIVEKHKAVRQSADELLNKLKIKNEDNPISQSLRTNVEQVLNTLQALDREEFDIAYIDQMVVFYQNVLDTIDNQLMPHADNEELKALLYNLFSPFSQHLHDGQQIQESLSPLSQPAPKS